MKLSKTIITLITVFLFSGAVLADDGYDLWLKYNRIDDAALIQSYTGTVTSVVVEGSSQTADIGRRELTKALSGLLGKNIPAANAVTADGAVIAGTPENSAIVRDIGLSGDLRRAGNEGYLIRTTEYTGYNVTVIGANTDIGTLYGAFAFLRLMQTGKPIDALNITQAPNIQIRMLNHWDNLNGSVERGYAGRSLWKWDVLPDTVDPRYTDYARANASIGINGTVINNVNADPRILLPEYIEKMTVLSDIFRPYGIKLYLAINFSSPLKSEGSGFRKRGGIGTFDSADPALPEVRQWWKDKVAELYEHIPDFGGFLVKANSEGMPGPQDYGRTHAEGANMLAEALEPYGGIVIWRSFVYDPNTDTDRVKRAFLEFVPQDGDFLTNVFVQPKNGPLDFQPREPVHPLFGAMPKTPLMLELQVTQEYLGHSTHLVYLAPMWKECLDFDTYANGEGSTVGKVVDGSLHDYAMNGIAGVANIGDDRNWCGHLFGQANWYAYGRLAWDYTLTSENIADEWIRMTLSDENAVVAKIKSMMMGSHEACVSYMTPLGLHHIMQEGFHYGPQPSLFRENLRIDWTSVYYHKADKKGIGYDRSSSGSNATAQYFSPVRERFDSIETCPEELLLWFHHVPWNHRMKSGRTLWEELCYRYYSGVDYVSQMRKDWGSLRNDIEPKIHEHVRGKLENHEKDAAEWRDTCVNYFAAFSGMPMTPR